jgi:hypothetical protein
MKSPVIAAACALAALVSSTAARAACPPEAGDCEQVVENGNLGARIDLVILGDGYTEAERDKFYADAKAAIAGFLDSETYVAYKPVFNAYAIFTPSAQSGADHPSQGIAVDTAFGATYDYGGVPWALVLDYVSVAVELNARFPEKDMALVLVNDTEYGGTGGQVAVISLHETSIEIGRHELGHTFANLADEYTEPYPGYPEGDPEPNVASVEHLDPLKWEIWLTPGVSIPTPDTDAVSDHDPVGAFEGARYKTTGIFRPTSNCLMRELGITFCPVCAEAMVKSFSSLSLLIDAPVPASPAVIPAKGPTPFSATIPGLANLTFTWAVDGQMIENTAPAFALDPTALGLADGPHTVDLTVYDGSPLVRSDPDGVMMEKFTWDVAVDSTLPPITGSGGAGGGGGGGAGGDGGAAGAGGDAPSDPSCGCRFLGAEPEGASGWLLLGLASLAARRRRRS